MKMDFLTGNIGVKLSPSLYCWQDDGNSESIAVFFYDKNMNISFTNIVVPKQHDKTANNYKITGTEGDHYKSWHLTPSVIYGLFSTF